MTRVQAGRHRRRRSGGERVLHRQLGYSGPNCGRHFRAWRRVQLPGIRCQGGGVGRQTPAKVTRLAAGGEPLDAAVAAFLTDRDLAPSSHRVYVFTLARLPDHLGPETPVEQVSPRMLAEFMAARYPHLAAASWNRVVATLGSFFAYTTRQGWTPPSPAVGLERHRHRLDRDAHARSRAIPAADLLAFLRAKHPVRDKTLWWLLYESAARAGGAGPSRRCRGRGLRRPGRRSRRAATTRSCPVPGAWHAGRPAGRRPG